MEVSDTLNTISLVAGRNIMFQSCNSQMYAITLLQPASVLDGKNVYYGEGSRQGQYLDLEVLE
jgi:hypothetical protein